MIKYPGTDLQTYNLDWVIMEVKRIAKANGIEFNDENIHIGADNVQEAIDALYDLIMEISSQTNAVEIIDSTIVDSTWATGYTYTHLQTVNTPTLMAIIDAMRLSKSIILRRDVATNDELSFVLLEVTYDPILFKHELKFVNPYAHKVATLDIFGLNDDANVYAQILPDTTVKYVNTFNGRAGNVTPATHDYDADQVDYDNTTSGLVATDVQAAIDEVDNKIPSNIVETFNGRSGVVTPSAHDYDADQVDYDNTTSGLVATDVQAAIDEVDNKIPSNIVETFNGRSGVVTPAAHDYDADQVDYDNTTSGLVATDVQAAIDELVANPPAPVAADIDYSNTTSGLQATNVQAALDEIADDVLSSGVASFNGRTGAVNPAAHDYDAEQVDYDNTTSGLSATDTQSAIDELAAAIPTDVLGDLETETGNPLSITTDSAQVARSTKITLEPIQAAGTPTPSDPIPISGYGEISLNVTGKNIFNGADATLDRFSYSNGTFTNTNTDSKTYFSLSIQVQKMDNNVVTLTAESITATGAASITFTTPADTKNLLIRHSGTERDFSIVYPFPYAGEFTLSLNILSCDPTTLGGLSFNNVQVETGSSATEYAPYISATQITLPLSNTVYGGELDVETGVLKVMFGIVDLGNLNWSHFTDGAGVSFFFVTNENLPTNFKASSGAKCSIYQTVVSADVDTNFPLYKMALRDTFHNQNLSVKDDRYTTATDFKPAVSGQKLVYELETPYEIQLTPHEVELLLGANVITSNGTSITLVYREGEIAALSDIKAVNDFLAAEIENVSDVADDAKTAADAANEPLEYVGMAAVDNADITIYNMTANIDRNDLKYHVKGNQFTIAGMIQFTVTSRDAANPGFHVALPDGKQIATAYGILHVDMYKTGSEPEFVMATSVFESTSADFATTETYNNIAAGTYVWMIPPTTFLMK